uniref:Uncharacterized protein n=1 Tax=Ananas comosus var. bracteatus TaxID=296719 RepID=A0A6V7QX56_ANACO
MVLSTTARMARVAETSCGTSSVPVEHFRKTTRANQRCAEEVVSAVLFGVWVASVDDSLPREDAVTHLTSFVSRLLVLAVDIYSHKIKNHLEPQPEHGRIQFHRLNIKNGSQPEGVIKMTDLIRFSPFLRMSTEHLIDSPPDPVPPTQHQERLLTRGPHQDVGSGELLAFLPHHTRHNTPPPAGPRFSLFLWMPYLLLHLCFFPPAVSLIINLAAICPLPSTISTHHIQQFLRCPSGGRLSIGLKTASGSFTSPLVRCWEDCWKLSPKGSPCDR